MSEGRQCDRVVALGRGQPGQPLVHHALNDWPAVDRRSGSCRGQQTLGRVELAPFELRLTAETITQALRDGDQEAGQAGQGHNDHREESDT